MKNRQPYFDVAKQYFKEQHPNALCAFVAGSNLRGEASAYSDIDIVILYNNNFQDVRRESCIYQEWPLEAFIHNKQSCHYFMHADYERGKAPFIHMIKEGHILPIPCPEIAVEYKEKAHQYFEIGPKEWDEEKIARSRYFVSDLMDDLRGAENQPYKKNAILVNLYQELGELYLGGQNQWHGNGKSLLRLLQGYDSKFADYFANAFDVAFKGKNIQGVLNLCDDVLEIFGGRNWEQYCAYAPKDKWQNFRGPENKF